MKKYYLLSLTILSLISFTSKSQNIAADYVMMRDQLKYLDQDNSFYSTLAGSPYMEDEFVKGSIIIDGQADQPAYLKYNVAKDQIEIKANPIQNEIFVLPRNNTYSFKLDNYTYYYGNITTAKNGYVQGYLMKFYEGDDVRFIAKPVLDIEPAKVAETSYDKSKPATMEVKMEYYISVDGKPFEKIILRERFLRRRLKKTKPLEEYYDEHRINSEAEVVELLKFYDQNV
ncbi:MAG: hypothetical protein KJP01_04020 [Gramella sp.]|nr:hypothetical protein [Christiangramia sp.]